MRKHQFHVSPATVAMFEHKNTACMCSVIHHCLSPIQDSPLDALYIISTKSQSGRVGSLFRSFPYIHLNSQEPMPASLGEILWDFSSNWSKNGKLSSVGQQSGPRWSTNVKRNNCFLKLGTTERPAWPSEEKNTTKHRGARFVLNPRSCRPRLWILPRQIGQVSPATNPQSAWRTETILQKAH